MDKLEKDIEKFFVNAVEHHGGLCLKFTSPSWGGVPDRVVMVPGVPTFFVEFKRTGETVRDLQRHVIRKMTKAGALVHVVDSKEHGKVLLKHYIEGRDAGAIHTAPVPKRSHTAVD